MNWFRKEPIKPKEVEVPVEVPVDPATILAKIYELHPDRRYVMWFKYSVNPQHIEIIRKNLKKLFGTDRMSIIAGIREPEIYEFEEEHDGTKVSYTAKLNSNPGSESK